jgi:hypothetical protein
VSEKSDEIDGDFRSFTLSLSTPLPPLLKPEDKVPVSKRRHPVSDVADWGDRQPKSPGGSLFPTKPRWSGRLFPTKPNPGRLIDR